MYNKLFTKILDSSIWLEPTTTRIVWLTMLAAMDEDGFVQFASIANLAYRARVDASDCEVAVKILESPDVNSSDVDNEGRRIERVPGGWMILNATKYKELVTRVVIREQTRKRVERFRNKNNVTHTTLSPLNVTQSDTETDTETKEEEASELASAKVPKIYNQIIIPKSLVDSERFVSLWKQWIPYRMKIKKRGDFNLLFRNQIKDLEGLGADKAIAALEYSLSNGYLNPILPDKLKSKQNSNSFCP